MAQKDTCMSVEEARQLIMDPRYIIDEFIGAGAMACVYKAHERSTPNIYALKVLREEFYQRKGFVEIFEKEAIHMRDLQYPNMVRFYKFVNEEHIAYILMDYVEGEPLTKYIQEARQNGTKIPLDMIIRMMAQIARAINYLHDEGVIHRDIKPGNILIAGENHSAFLTDLGIAGGFESQEALGGAGTPSYMPYEQQIGRNVDHTVDIYAFAVMLFEVFTGRKPFLPPKGMTIKEAREAVRLLHQSAALPSLVELRPDLPEELDEIFERAMAKDPLMRYQDVMDFAQDIHELLKSRLPDDLKNFADIRPQEIVRAGGESTAQTHISQEMPPTPEPRNTRNILLLGGIAIVMIVLVVTLSIILNKASAPDEIAIVESTLELAQTLNVESTQIAEETSVLLPPTPFYTGEGITVALEDSAALGLGDNLDMSLAYAVLHGGAYVPLRLNVTDGYQLEFSLDGESPKNYTAYGIVFAYQDPENYMSLRVDTKNRVWLLEDWQAGVSNMLNRGDIDEDFPTWLSLSKSDRHLRFEIDEQVFQQDLDMNREGRLGLWLQIDDVSLIHVIHLQVGLIGTDIANLDNVLLPEVTPMDYVLQDIEALLATGDGATFDIQCPDFDEVYKKLGTYNEGNWSKFAPDAALLAEQARGDSEFIHTNCNGQDAAFNFTFEDYQKWEDNLTGLLNSN